MKLTARTIAALTLPAGKTDHIEWDDEMPRFGYRLRVGSAGKVLRSWVVQYRRAGGTRRITLGQVATAEAARAAARRILAKVDLGDDPQGDRHDRRDKDKLTLRSVIEEYLAVKAPDVAKTTLREITRYLTGPYFKALHGTAIDKVTRRDVASRLVAITREHGPVVASAARAKLMAFFAWAMQMGLLPEMAANPVAHTPEPKRNGPRERVLSDQELAALWHACEDDDYGRIIKLATLLGARRAEIGGMTWSELDLEGGTWVLAPSRSKNREAHTLPLLPMVRAIVESIPRMATRDLLFGLHSERGFTNWDEGKAALDQRSGVREWRPHDIRRTVNTKLNDLGVAPHIVEEILGHRGAHKAGSARHYNFARYEHDVRTALALWERFIALVLDRDLYAAHQASLARGDEQARKRASESFRDAIKAGGGHWEDYVRVLKGGSRKVLPYAPATAI